LLRDSRLWLANKYYAKTPENSLNRFQVSAYNISTGVTVTRLAAITGTDPKTLGWCNENVAGDWRRSTSE
jgi:uncharacterized membrane protein